MTSTRSRSGRRWALPAALALSAAGVGLALPAVSDAAGRTGTMVRAPAVIAGLPFTPANVDPSLALKVAALMGAENLRFTPATRPVRDRTVTVAVRVDKATARAISVRRPLENLAAARRDTPLAVAATRYNLGLARGYQSFVQPARAAAVDAGLRNVPMPDLASFRPATTGDAKPSRFQSRIALEKAARAGKGERIYGAEGDQSIDVSGSYRLGRNLDVTAGVRLSPDRNRLDPLTDSVDDDKAVYVGTQVKF